MNDKKNINLTNNDGAKFRYSANRGKKDTQPGKAQTTGKAQETDKKEQIKEALTDRAVFWRTNKVFAIFVLVAVVILSSLWSIHRAVSSKAKVVEGYYTEVEAGNTDVKKNVVKMRDFAVQLVALNESVNPDDALNADYRAAIEKLDKNVSTPFWKDPSAAKDLLDRSASVYNSIKLSDKANGSVKTEAENIYDEIDNCYKKLRGDFAAGYAKAAKDYNKVISRFPVSIFSHDEAPVFD